MDRGVAFVAGAQPAEVVQVREAALDDPALASQTGAVFGGAASDHGLDPSRPQQATVLVVVIAAIGQDEVGLLTRPALLSGNRSAVQILQERDQLGDVVAVAGGQRDGQRNAAGVDEQVVL